MQQSLLPKPGQPGFWHALGRVASKIGNVAGDILDPGAMSIIPGTDLYGQIQHVQNQRLLTSLQKQDQDEQNDSSRRNVEGATAAHLGEETAEMPATQQAELGLKGAQEAEATQKAKNGPDLASGYSAAVNAAIAAGRDPSTDPVVQHIADAITAIQKQPAESGAGKTTDIKGPDGQIHTMGYNPTTKKFDVDEGVSGFKPAVTNNNAADGRAFQEAERGRGLLDKAEQNYRSAQQGANTMRDMLAQADAGNKMSAQILPLEGALQITTAQGVHRINRTEVEQYAGAGSLYDKIQGELGKVSSGQPIPPNIRNDIRKLVSAQEKQAYGTYRGAYDSATKRYNLTGEEALPEPGGGQPTGSGQVFDAKAWAAANPGKDVNKAIAKAQSLGHQVKQ